MTLDWKLTVHSHIERTNMNEQPHQLVIEFAMPVASTMTGKRILAPDAKIAEGD